MYLALEKSGHEETDSVVQRHTPQAPTSLDAPPVVLAEMRHSPSVSLRHFSFNPEAREFQPGTSPFLAQETAALPRPDENSRNEPYLRLSIPTPTPTKELAESLAGLGCPPGRGGLHPHDRSSRPSLSRGVSNISSTSFWRASRSHMDTSANTPAKASSKEVVYSCGICWIRVRGRVYVCPACGHVAHVDCLGEELGADEDECMVGCGCGCGVEENDERSRMEAYLDDVRAANAAGQYIAWVEDDESMHMHSQPPTPSLYTESACGDEFMTGTVSKTVEPGEEKRRERLAGRSTTNTSPTPSRDRKKKTKKKAKASGLSYY